MSTCITGTFSAEKNPNIKILGVLEINDSGESVLTTEQAFSKDNSIQEGYILGEDSNGQKISILDTQYIEKTTASLGKPHPSKIFGHLIFLGDRHIKSTEKLRINEFKVSLSCDSWFYENRLHESQKYITPTPKKINIKYDTLTTLSIISSHCFETGRLKTTATFKCMTEQDLKYFQKATHHLVTFISFATGSLTKHGNFSLKSSDETELKLMYKPGFYPHQKHTNCRYLFNYKSEKVGEKFLHWIKLYDKAPAIFKLYFLPKMITLDNTTKFLILTQAMECFNRKFYENEKLSLIARVNETINNKKYHSFLLASSDPTTLLKLGELIRDTRNYYTHYNDEKYENVISETNLIFLNIKVELLNDLLLLSNIGFSEKDYAEIKTCIIDDQFNRQRHMSTYTNY